MAKLTSYNKKVCLVVVTAAFSFGYGASVFVTSVGQPGFYSYYNLNPSSRRKSKTGRPNHEQILTLPLNQTRPTFLAQSMRYFSLAAPLDLLPSALSPTGLGARALYTAPQCCRSLARL